MSSGLKKNTSLTKLLISSKFKYFINIDNGLRSTFYLNDILKYNTTLTHLDIECNYLLIKLVNRIDDIKDLLGVLSLSNISAFNFRSQKSNLSFEINGYNLPNILKQNKMKMVKNLYLKDLFFDILFYYNDYNKINLLINFNYINNKIFIN
jgi:hypothetical protein